MITKEEINELREEFNKRFSELEDKLEQQTDCEQKSSKRWKPEGWERYYCVTSEGEVKEYDWYCNWYNNFHYSQGNCFKTEEEASQHLENLKTKVELKALAEELNGDKVIDWENIDQHKYFIYCLHSKEDGSSLYKSCDTITHTQATYCLDPDFLIKAKERIGEDRLIKMIKSGV